jgi:hypothetical protein
MVSIVRAAIITGPTTRITHEIRVTAQLKRGMRRHAMPGARRRRTVTIMFTAQRTNPIVASPTPMIQLSIPRPGLKTVSESGARPRIPPSPGVYMKLV